MKAIALMLLLMPGAAGSQTVMESSALHCRTASGKVVRLYAARECKQCYYYQPVTLEISRNTRSGAPEISLLTWKNEQTSKDEGAILHFLLEWGLSEHDEAGIMQCVRAEGDSLGRIMGAVLVSSARQITIAGRGKLASIMRSSLTSQPVPATTPGAKMAFSFRIGEETMEEFLALIRKRGYNDATIQITYAFDICDDSGNTQPQVAELEISIEKIFRELNNTP